ncbi:fumarylacetoacetate hydrolase family protein [Geodermatophilus sp. YIM 151500]|uniref:fumarylacetoacetate hydrolase family protein n=1 Tax=Geodermatophilus sp. YIM 151500 TaxID=2984531 RepID=UPI0021E4D6E2|nr:fumarylacetoacetate hydrolase family protein [Geodermatophilus sp. YIM 151500]MCV2489765.1 fumarylacetoacetate hydrolase family protein [Geodermatophilus sp. YIM 151500]
MRLLNLDGRLQVSTASGLVDVAAASRGHFSSGPQDVYDRWEEFVAWCETSAGDLTPTDTGDLDPVRLGAPSPRPRQVFAVGLNYADHAAEAGIARPETPVIFTKFASAISGPVTTVSLPPGSVDWEVELVVVIGRGGRGIPAARAWDAVAGLSVGQDLSERRGQMSGPVPQFSLAKSHRGFAPIGPALVTIDELDNPDDLDLGATINGEVVQRSRTSQMIFSVPDLVAYLSRTVELCPGDVLFTGTPPGVGVGRTPPRFLGPGDVLRSHVEGIGELVQTFTGPDETLLVPDRMREAG